MTFSALPTVPVVWRALTYHIVPFIEGMLWFAYGVAVPGLLPSTAGCISVHTILADLDAWYRYCLLSIAAHLNIVMPGRRRSPREYASVRIHRTERIRTTINVV